jgi:hypothetical protein
MPQIKNIQKRVPRIGKIRIGEKVATGRGGERPKALDHFICAEDDYKEAFREAFGDKPSSIEIMFHSDDDDDILPNAYKLYTSTYGLTCAGDGERATRIYDVNLAHNVQVGDKPEDPNRPEFWPPATGQTKGTDWKRKDDLTCTVEQCPQYKGNLCSLSLNLKFMLPQLPGIGIWQLDSRSINSLMNLSGGIAGIKGMTGGVIAGLPIRLSLVDHEARPEGQTKKTVKVLSLTYAGTPFELREQVRMGMAGVLEAQDIERETGANALTGEVIEQPALPSQGVVSPEAVEIVQKQGQQGFDTGPAPDRG